MILNEREFVQSYGSFWRDTLPFCEVFVRHLNGAHAGVYAKEVTSSVPPGRRALVNELAFSLFCAGVEHGGLHEVLYSQRRIDQIYANTVESMRRFLNLGFPPGPLTRDERAEAFRLARRTEEYFARLKATIRVRPTFAGCGTLEKTEGDVLCGTCLFEVKAGHRAFRGIDVRQLLTYCALNNLSREHDIQRVGLVNPRTGTYFTEDLGVLCVRISGESAQAVLGRIQEFLSGALASP